MKLILVLLLVVFSSVQSFSQQYFRKTTDFADSVNRRFVHDIEPLGAVLLRGYLTGQLKAYNFNVNGKEVKWKPVAPEDLPDDWDPKMEYYGADRVTYKGKYYFVGLDVAFGTPPPSSQWTEYEPYGEPVSTIWSFPGTQDTLRKADLLKNFIMEEDRFESASWDPLLEYYVQDVILFQGKYYECQIDGSGKQPDLFPENWLETRPRILFYSPRDLAGIDIIYWRDETGRLVPQTLSLNYMDYNIEMARSSGLNFYYPDVVEFLSRQQQLPMLFQSDFGYTGAPQLLIGWDSSQPILQLIRSNFSGVLKPSKKDIIDAAKYSAFLEAKEDALQSGDWSVVQDLTTNDLTLTLRDFNNSGVANAPVVKIPWKALEKLLRTKQPQARTWGYLEGLDANAFRTRLDTLAEVDSLDAKFKRLIAVPVTSSRYFIDERSATVKDNPAKEKSITSLWIMLKKALNEKQIVAQHSRPSYFRCDQPFPELSIKTEMRTWNFDAGFKFESVESVVVDSTVAIYPIGRLAVQYKRTVTNQKSKSPLFEPVKVGLGFFNTEMGLYLNYYFLWEDVVKLAATNAGLTELVEAMKMGTLKFDSGEYVYGLVGK